MTCRICGRGMHLLPAMAIQGNAEIHVCLNQGCAFFCIPRLTWLAEQRDKIEQSLKNLDDLTKGQEHA